MPKTANRGLLFFHFFILTKLWKQFESFVRFFFDLTGILLNKQF
jgi:hypothetical protein